MATPRLAIRLLVASISTAAVGLTGCVDAPVTPDQLEPNGQLRPGQNHAAFSAQDRAVAQTAIHVSAVLAPQPDGALEDRSSFSADVGTVHLHLRADGLMAARPVVFRWTHLQGDPLSVLVPGMLAPNSSMDLAASFDIEPDQFGAWRVEVLDQAPAAGEEPRVLFERDFQVERPSV